MLPLSFNRVIDDVSDSCVPNPIFPAHGAVTLQTQKLQHSRSDSSSGSHFRTAAQAPARAVAVCSSPSSQSTPDIQRTPPPHLLKASLHPAPLFQHHRSGKGSPPPRKFHGRLPARDTELLYRKTPACHKNSPSAEKDGEARSSKSPWSLLMPHSIFSFLSFR